MGAKACLGTSGCDHPFDTVPYRVIKTGNITLRRVRIILFPVEKRQVGNIKSVFLCSSASCTMGTGYLPGVKRPGRGVDHTPPSRAEVKERV